MLNDNNLSSDTVIGASDPLNVRATFGTGAPISLSLPLRAPGGGPAGEIQVLCQLVPKSVPGAPARLRLSALLAGLCVANCVFVLTTSSHSSLSLWRAALRLLTVYE